MRNSLFVVSLLIIFGVSYALEPCCDCLRAITSDFRVVQFRDVSGFVNGQPAASWEVLTTIEFPNKTDSPLQGVSQTISSSTLKYTFAQRSLVVTTNADFQPINIVDKQELIIMIGVFGTGDDCGFQRVCVQTPITGAPYIGNVIGEKDGEFIRQFSLRDPVEDDDFGDTNVFTTAFEIVTGKQYIPSKGRLWEFHYDLEISEPTALLTVVNASEPEFVDLETVSIFYNNTQNDRLLWAVMRNTSSLQHFLVGPINTAITNTLAFAEKRLLPTFDDNVQFKSVQFGCFPASLECKNPILPLTIQNTIVAPAEGAAIIGGTVGGAAVLIVVIIVALIFVRREIKKRKGLIHIVPELTDMEIDSKLGSGQFGTVYKGTWQKTTPVALKCLQGANADDFSRELGIIVQSNHPNIVRFFGKWINESNMMYLVMEFVQGGDVLHFLHQNPGISFSIMLDLISGSIAGLKFLHTNNIVHRDLAARNLLVKEEHGKLSVKIADFGMSFSQSIKTKSNTDLQIPVRWTAPEIFLENPQFSVKSDMWSFGVCCWEIVSRGKVPYGNISKNEAVVRFVLDENVLQCTSEEPGIEQLYQQLMMRCWKFDPEDRIDVEQARQILEKICDRFYNLEGDQTATKKETSKNEALLGVQKNVTKESAPYSATEDPNQYGIS